MTLHRATDRIHRRLRFGRILALNAELTILIFVVLGHSFAQFPKPAVPAPPKPEATAPHDLLGRENPRSAMMGLLKSTARDDYETATRYLQPVPGQDLVQMARDVKTLRPKFRGNIASLTDNPEGEVQAGLPPGQVRAGVFTVDGINVDVILVRVDDPTAGKIWLISKETLARIPALYAQMQSQAPSLADRIMPAALSRRRMLGMSLAQWLEWLLSIPLSWFLAWLLVSLLGTPKRIWCMLRKRPYGSAWETRHGRPISCMIAILLHSIFVYLLGPPLLYRVYYFRLMAVLLAACFLWLLSTIIDRSYEHALNRSRTQRKGGESILIVLQRLTRVVLLLIGLLVALALFGINLKTTLAGLGIGGIAIALAAQKTLENLIGGVSLLMDKAIRVGDFCQVGNQLGTVEDIGLRSLKLRTLDQNMSVVPNGSLAQMQFQNMARRGKLLINQTFSLRIETQAEQLRFVLDHVQGMLDQHPSIEPGTCRVRVMSFVGAAFQLELFAYGKTGDWAQFTKIRQDVILRIAEIVEASGTRFAPPTQLSYRVDEQKLDNNTVRRGVDLSPHGFMFPSEPRTGTE